MYQIRYFLSLTGVRLFFGREQQSTVQNHTNSLENVETERRTHQDTYVEHRKTYKDHLSAVTLCKEQRAKLKEEERMLKEALNKDQDA